ncbi:hypothetical protein PVAP13_9NG184973 [Panicum virgatum]|uniref:Uncharacterized protein n=1 Tax=Panicum virgatum TaxID=38727 RepID=A0A8T0MMJ5_PANVG|nr:hypothetical protein PVAP13_9NG184973 [Panicum virgatum]
MAEAGAGGEQYRKLSRVPSMAFDRLRSFNLSRFAAPAPEPAVAGAVDLGYEQPPVPVVEKEEPVVIQRVVKPEPKPELEPETEREHAARPVGVRALRGQGGGGGRAGGGGATHREDQGGGRRTSAAEPELEPEEEAGPGGEADAFTNKFHHQLKLQRIESFIRYRETVRRGRRRRRLGRWQPEPTDGAGLDARQRAARVREGRGKRWREGMRVKDWKEGMVPLFLFPRSDLGFSLLRFLVASTS